MVETIRQFTDTLFDKGLQIRFFIDINDQFYLNKFGICFQSTKKTKINIIKNSKAAVERLAGRIRNITVKTGSQSGIIELLNLNILVLPFEIK